MASTAMPSLLYRREGKRYVALDRDAAHHVLERLVPRADGEHACFRPSRHAQPAALHPPTEKDFEPTVAYSMLSSAKDDKRIVCMLTGLTKSELNGRRGHILFFHQPSQRLAVKLVNDASEPLRLRPSSVLVRFLYPGVYRDEFGETDDGGLKPSPTWVSAAREVVVHFRRVATVGSAVGSAELSFSAPYQCALHDELCARTAGNAVLASCGVWSCDQPFNGAARYVLPLGPGAKADGRLGEDSPSPSSPTELRTYWALIREVHGAVARLASDWRVVCEPSLVILPYHVTSAVGARFAFPIAYGCERPDHDVADDALDEPTRWLLEALETASPLAEVRTDFGALTLEIGSPIDGDGAVTGAEDVAVPSALVSMAGDDGSCATFLDGIAKHVAAQAPAGAVVRLDNCGHDGRSEGGLTNTSLTQYFGRLEDVRGGALDGFVDDERGEFFCMHLAHDGLVKNRQALPSIEPYDVVELAELVAAAPSAVPSPIME